MSSERDFMLVEQLHQRLKAPLPGAGAQWLMAAVPEGNKSFDFDYEEPPVESSVMILLFRRHDAYYFPLIRRSEYGGVHGGQIGLPGGKYEPEDTDRVDTAFRETHEELGIDMEEVRLIGNLSELYIRASNYNVLPVIGFLPRVPVYQPDPVEVSGVIECNLDLLLNDQIAGKKILTGRNGIRIIAPYYDIANQVVWGATAMILCEFKTILREIH